MINAYPLTWPSGWQKTPETKRRAAAFGKTRNSYNAAMQSNTSHKGELSVAEGAERILASLNRMGIPREDIVISTNVRTRLDGMPRSNEPEPSDPGAAVYWVDPFKPKEPLCMAIDQYLRVADNLAALAATLEAMRSIERHGGATIMNRAFRGFTALPAPGQTSHSWRDELNVDAREANIDKVKKNYMLLRSANHPDRGGDPSIFDRINSAWKMAQQELSP